MRWSLGYQFFIHTTLVRQAAPAIVVPVQFYSRTITDVHSCPQPPAIIDTNYGGVFIHLRPGCSGPLPHERTDQQLNMALQVP